MTPLKTINQPGFSLVEILVALVIVLLVGGIGISVANNAYKKSQISTTKQKMRHVAAALNSFNQEINQYPESLDDLVQRPENEELAKNWSTQFLGNKPGDKKDLMDAWGTQFQYTKTPDGENPYELYSYGPNKKRAQQAEWINIWNIQ